MKGITSMTRKHFIAIARIIATKPTLDQMIAALADFFATVNDNFDRDKFVQACSPESLY